MRKELLRLLDFFYFIIAISFVFIISLFFSYSIFLKFFLGVLSICVLFFINGNSFVKIFYLFTLTTAVPIVFLTIPLVREYSIHMGINDVLILFFFLLLISVKLLQQQSIIGFTKTVHAVVPSQSFMRKNAKDRVLMENNKDRLLAPIIIIFITMLLSLVRADDRRISYIYLFFMFEGFIIYSYILTFFQNEESLKKLLYLLFGIVFFYSLYGLMQYKFGSLPYIGGIEIGRFASTQVWRVRANLSHPNCLAGFITTFLPLLYVSFHKERVWHNVLLCLIIVIALFALGATYSRNGYIAFASGFISVVALMIIKHKNVTTPIIMVSGVLLLLIIISLVLPFAGQRLISLKYFMADLASIQRLVLWIGSLKTFPGNPMLGVGVANFIYLPFAQELLVAHNLFLTTLVTTGLLGLCAVFYIFFIVFKYLFISFKKIGDTDFLNRLSIGLLGAWIAFVSHNLFDEIWTSPHHITEMKYLWIFIGMTSVFLQLSRHANKQIAIEQSEFKLNSNS